MADSSMTFDKGREKTEVKNSAGMPEKKSPDSTAPLPVSSVLDANSNTTLAADEFEIATFRMTSLSEAEEREEMKDSPWYWECPCGRDLIQEKRKYRRIEEMILGIRPKTDEYNDYVKEMKERKKRKKRSFSPVSSAPISESSTIPRTTVSASRESSVTASSTYIESRTQSQSSAEYSLDDEAYYIENPEHRKSLKERLIELLGIDDIKPDYVNLSLFG